MEGSLVLERRSISLSGIRLSTHGQHHSTHLMRAGARSGQHGRGWPARSGHQEQSFQASRSRPASAPSAWAPPPRRARTKALSFPAKLSHLRMGCTKADPFSLLSPSLPSGTLTAAGGVSFKPPLLGRGRGHHPHATPGVASLISVPTRAAAHTQLSDLKKVGGAQPSLPASVSDGRLLSCPRD